MFFVFCCLSIGLILCEIINEENSSATTNQKEEDINIVQSQSESNILSRQKRMPVIGYLSMILGLINTAMLIVSNVVINNSGTNPNNNFKKRSIADEDKENYHSDLPPIDFELMAKEPRKVLSRQKRTFPVFGFLSFLMLLLNSTMLIQVRDFSSSFLTSCRKINSSIYFFSAKYQQQQQ